MIVGLLSLITPAVWGNGYSTVQHYLQSPPLFSAIAVVFVQTAGGAGQQRIRRAGRRVYPTLFVGLAMGMLFASFSGLCTTIKGWRL
jgi:CIC family chloride channel protein